MIKLLIVDDHPIFREGLKQILWSYDDSIVIDEAENGKEAFQKVATARYDLIILDLEMPGRNGLEVLEALKQERLDLNILILSMYSEEQYAIQAIRAGAAGYLTKNGAARELIVAIQKILAGGMYISTTVAEQLAIEVKGGNRKAIHELLSSREFKVICMIANGKRISEIADELSVSTSTISTHRARILKKLNLKNNADIIRYALKNNLVNW